MSDPFVKVIAHSISVEGIPIITMHMRYWRAILAEVNTHRQFSRNTRSSRAVPTEKMITEIICDPFIPRHWGKNQKGMQATEECDAPVFVEGFNHFDMIDCTYDSENRVSAWLGARDQAVKFAKGFSDAGYHKQIVNRLVEPFMWTDSLITSTNWANFFNLRDHKDAEPHFRDLAQLAKEAKDKSSATLLGKDEWHLPYIKDEELELNHDLRKISAARCARISYAPFDGDSSIERELERYKLLVDNQPVHASPVEHQATPDFFDDKYGHWENEEEHRNFYGWRQFRAMIPNETTRDEFTR